MMIEIGTKILKFSLNSQEGVESVHIIDLTLMDAEASQTNVICDQYCGCEVTFISFLHNVFRD